MKNNGLDSLFREKLGNMEIEPSEKARDSFDQLLSTGKRKILIKRLSIAAGILLIMSAGMIWLNSEKKNDTISENSTARSMNRTEQKEDSTAVIKDRNITKPPEPAAGQEVTDAGTKKVQKKRKIANQGSDQVPLIIPESNQDIAANESNTTDMNEALKDTVISTSIASNETMEIKPGINESKDNTGMMGLKESNVDKADKPIKITIEYIASNSSKKKKDENKLNIRQLYSLGNGLKLPEDYLGNIRTLKDQLFAFEFNKEKIKTQNNKK